MTNARTTALKFCYTTIFCSTCLFAAGAAAQDVSGQVESTLVLEEVIVTVTKRAESVQDVASTISALSNEQLRDFQVQNMSDVADFMPNVVVKNAGKISIRGISAAGFQGSNAPQPVAQHENGLFIAEIGTEYPFYDIDSIEVVRGPSGTVFGRNATSGAINVRWAEPTDEWGGSLEYRVRSNEYDDNVRQTQGYLNAPLVKDYLQLRLAFVDYEREALYDNLAAPKSDDPGEGPLRWMRAYLTSQPLDNLRLRLRYIDRQSEDKNINSPPAEVRASGLLQQLGATPLPVNDLNAVRTTLFEGSSAFIADTAVFRRGGDGDNQRLDGDISLQLSDLPVVGDIELFLLAGHSESTNNNISDSDGSDTPILDTINGFKREQTSGEFRITSTGDDVPFNWILGYFWSEFDMDVDVALAGSVTDPSLPGQVLVLNGINPQATRNKAEAFFFNAELDLEMLLDNGPAVTLFGGLRENKDETRLFGMQSLEIVGIRPVGADPGVFIPLPLGDVGAGPFSGDDDFSQTTGEAGARWYFQQDAMTYFKYAKGYKAGKLQQLPPAQPGGTGETGEVKPELLDAFELGLKSRLLEGRMTLNAAAFYYDYADLQVTQLRGSQPLVNNATDATVWGLEADLHYRVLENLTMAASVGYLATEFDEFCSQDPFAPVAAPQGSCPSDNPQDLSGKKLPDAPDLTASLILQHDWDLGDYGSLTTSLKSIYRGESFRRPQNSPVDQVDSYTMTDLRLLWSSPENTFEFELFAENLEDEDQIWLTAVDLSSAGQMALLDHQPGRRYGAAVKLNF